MFSIVFIANGKNKEEIVKKSTKEDIEKAIIKYYKSIEVKVENEYKNWYLLKLNENWTRVIEGDLASTGEITGLSQQKNFYYDEVRSIDNKVFVIVSDALRYDVAATLMDQLRILFTIPFL